MGTPTVTVGAEGVTLDILFDCLADGSRRHLLSALYDRAPGALTRRDLATHIAAVQCETSPGRVPNDEFQQAYINVHHTHLPKLEAAGLIEQEPDRDIVTITDHAAVQDSGILESLDEQETMDRESLDTLFRALVDPRRRTVLASLHHSSQQVQMETLARDVGARERGIPESAVPVAEVEKILSTFHHIHLPYLADAKLIEYEPDERLVTSKAHPMVDMSWLRSVLSPDSRTLGKPRR